MNMPSLDSKFLNIIDLLRSFDKFDLDYSYNI